MSPVIDVVSGSRIKMVMENTWGHMMCEKRKWYRGRITVAYGEDGGVTRLASNFMDGRRDWPGGGPWFHEHLEQWLGDVKDRRPGVYEWEGYYMWYRNGNHRFTKGSWRLLLNSRGSTDIPYIHGTKDSNGPKIKSNQNREQMKMLGRQLMDPFKAMVSGEAMFAYHGRVHYHEHGLMIKDCENLRSWAPSHEPATADSIVSSTKTVKDPTKEVIMFHPMVRFIAPIRGERHSLPDEYLGEEVSETPIPAICVLTNTFVVSGMYSHHRNGAAIRGVNLLSEWNTTRGLGELALANGPINPTLAAMPDMYLPHSSVFHLMMVNNPGALGINVTL